MSIRLHTQLKVKRLHKSDGGRWIVGTATTPTTNRMGDIVRPEGAEYRLPLVLLAHHDHSRPVGSVVEANVSPARIELQANAWSPALEAELLKRFQGSAQLAVRAIGGTAL